MVALHSLEWLCVAGPSQSIGFLVAESQPMIFRFCILVAGSGRSLWSWFLGHSGVPSDAPLVGLEIELGEEAD